MPVVTDGIRSETSRWDRTDLHTHRARLAHRFAIRAGLVWTIVRTDFKARYHGTASGFVWALLKPLAMFVVLMGVFSFLFRDPTYKLNLIVALFLWDFFAEGTKTGLTSLHAKGFLLTKARCPSWILVVTSISNAVITVAAFSFVIAIFLVVVGRAPSAGAIALFLAYGVALVAIVVGFSLGSSVLFLRYRDLDQVWDVVTQAGFFLAPIIYPLGIVPERLHFYFYLWPPTPIIEFSRAVLVRGTIPTRTAHLYLAADAAFILIAGIVIFRWFAPRAAEYL
jgi:lipopolysaccharide transport system permease protein